MNFLIGITFFLALFNGEVGFSQTDGSLDISFGDSGKVITDFGGDDYGYSVAIQSDGKIIVAGYSYNGTNFDFALVKYNTDGTLDNTFSSDGIVTTDISEDDYGYSVAIQTDGKIVVAGESNNGTNYDFALVRYNTDGGLDVSFDSDGKIISDFGGYDEASSVVIQSDGKIIVAGYSNVNGTCDFALVRYNSNGTLDTTFDGDGKVITDFGGEDAVLSLALQSNGKIIASGIYNSDFALARYNSDGTLDNTFDSDGKVITDFGGSDEGHSVTIQADEKIIVAGQSYNSGNYDFALVRYNSDGTLDNTFGSNGKVITDFGGNDFGGSVAIQSDGKIVIASWTASEENPNFILVRYYTNGIIDTTFGSNGKVITDFGENDIGESVVIQSNGKIIVVGYSDSGGTYDFALSRYICPSVSVNEIYSEQPNVNIYPNPAMTGEFFVEFNPSDNERLIEINVKDITGKLIATENIKDNFSLFHFQFSIYNGAKRQGIYIVQVITDKRTINKKVVVY